MNANGKTEPAISYGLLLVVDSRLRGNDFGKCSRIVERDYPTRRMRPFGGCHLQGLRPVDGYYLAMGTISPVVLSYWEALPP